MADRLDALTVREHNGKSYWTKIGAAFPNKSGVGYIVRLDAMPASNEGQFSIHLREPLPPKEGQQQGAKAEPSQADLDDDIPY